MEGPLYFNPNSPNDSCNELWINKVLLFFKEENERTIARNDQGEQTVSTLALFTVIIVVNSLGVMHVDDGNLCETKNYLEIRQISTKINNAPAITG